MEIKYKRYYNQQKNREEFELVNFPYIDGNDYISNEFCRQFDMKPEEKLDGIWITKHVLHGEDADYAFMWHEDVGNYVYSMHQSREDNDTLERRLKTVLDIVGPTVTE